MNAFFGRFSHQPLFFEDYARARDAAKPAAPERTGEIYTLTIDCVWGAYLEEPCTRVIECKDDTSLLDLHSIIQKAVQFDDDHLFEFFAGRSVRKREMLFSTNEDEPELDDYADVTLKRIWPLPERMKLFYWFDYGDDWKFQIKKGRAVTPRTKGARYPRVIREIGPNPKQYPDFE